MLFIYLFVEKQSSKAKAQIMSCKTGREKLAVRVLLLTATDSHPDEK